MNDAVKIHGLNFSYDVQSPVFRDLSLTLKQGSRTVLIGANGVGKTTLLRLIAGRHIIEPEVVQVFNRAAFHDTALSREISLVDGIFPVTADIGVDDMLAHGRDGVDAKVEQELVKILDVSSSWRMNRISQGQRHRVELLLSLRKPAKLLLLDEVTAHLDIVARANFLAWLKQQSEKRGVTIFYTTHILDGLWQNLQTHWPTHLVFLTTRGIEFVGEMGQIPELKTKSLLQLCEDWIRADINSTLK